ncbi:hypothetical protein H6P81_002338 [Aristolochia fimbriata]|uniref:Protein kinase domain-containing protein n=1 Tax=Aristolochia fimbriata TaxID=158543 RepID=A0AAV7F9H4_ARIFI|nr:hypothetical protein H6P81_002338 [Aristolochia fimbriata]
MNFTDRISNQSTIYYSEGRYNRHYSSPKRVSSAPEGSPVKQTKRKESTKDWVVRSFYSASQSHKSTTAGPKRNISSTSGATNPKSSPAPVDDRVNGNSGKDSFDHQMNKKEDSHDGKPAVFFQQSLIDSQAEKFKFCLVGKFPKWRPSLSQIREWATAKWRLKGLWSITLLDHRHVFVTLDNEDDMVRVWARNRWFVEGHLMKVFKWFPTFVPSQGEPPSAAIWVSLPFLPVAFFQEELLSPIAALAGKVLAIDGPTRNLSRTNVARVCVEVDLLEEDVPWRVWVGVGEGGFWQDLCYERLPSYCTHCRQQGHSTKACEVKRSNSRTGNQKPRIKNPISHTRMDRRSQEHFSKTKRARISPIIEDEDESGLAIRQESNQSKGKGKEVGSASEPSLPLSPDESSSASSGEQRAECSKAVDTSEQVVLAEDPEDNTDSEGEAVLVAQSVPLHTEVRWKGFGLEQGESFHGVERKSPPRKKKPTSKRPIFFWKTKQKEIPVAESRPFMPPTVMNYKYSEIKKMTRTFGDKLGEGGFGTVYRGALPDGREVAVKIGKERARVEEFSNEMEIIRDVCHTNVIQLLGFCSEGARGALVYEFMPNGSLDKIIHSKEPKSPHSVRSKQLCEIAVGVARGLEYLQHGCYPAIVHLDVKPSNILLDKNLCPKLSDFGLARRCGSHSGSATVRGTMGYIAPELCWLGRFSTRTDVYSYGIMLLEMALRMKPVNFNCYYQNDPGSQEKFLVDWVIKKVTPQGGIPGHVWEATERKMILVGLWCAQYNPANRPSFGTIVDMLEGSVDDLNVPTNDPRAYRGPAFLMGDVSDRTNADEYEASAANIDDDINSCSTSSLVGR